MQLAPTIPSPLAGGEDLRLRHALPHVWTQRGSAGARPFGVYWSDRDGLGRLHPEPTDAELGRFYDTASYDAYMGDGERAGAGHAAAARPRLSARVLARVARCFDRSVPLTPELLHDKLGGQPGRRMCDLGCGGGAMLRGVQALGHEVLGVDPSPVAIESGRRGGWPVLAGTAEALPPDCPRGAFDLVLLSHSLEHCRDPQRALQNAASLLAAGGALVVEVPNHACAGFAGSGAAWFHTDAGRHLWFFTPTSLERLAQDAGLRSVDFEFDGFARQFAWLAAEQEVWDALYAANPAAVAATRRPSVGSQVRMLVRGLSGGRQRRYDSVRMIARKP